MNIIIIGINSSYYSAWAVNLALSLRYHSPDIKINYITEKHLFDDLPGTYKSLFDKTIFVSRDDIMYNGIYDIGRFKLRIPEFAGKGKNLYIDADTLIIKDISDLPDTDFDIHYIDTRTSKDRDCDWIDCKNIFKLFDIKEFPIINTSFVLFKNNKTIKELYKRACNLIDEIPEKHIYKWGNIGAHPDELYLSVALAESDIQLTKTKYIYFRHMNEGGEWLTRSDIEKTYYGIGLYGDERHIHKSIYYLYNYYSELYHRAMFDSPSPFNLDRLIKNKFITKTKI